MAIVMAFIATVGIMAVVVAAQEKLDPSTSLITAIKEMLEVERARQERELGGAGSSDRADAAGPKEISIHCPVQASVKIRDLPEEVVRNNECLVLHLDAPDLSAKLVVKCDGKLGDSSYFGEDW
jgi:hypothetical protein